MYAGGRGKREKKIEKKNWKRVTLKDRFQGMSLCEKNILWLATYFKYGRYGC